MMLTLTRPINLPELERSRAAEEEGEAGALARVTGLVEPTKGKAGDVNGVDPALTFSSAR